MLLSRSEAYEYFWTPEEYRRYGAYGPRIFTDECSKGLHDKCGCLLSCVCRCHATTGQWKGWK